jgi:hypothetical protein
MRRGIAVLGVPLIAGLMLSACDRDNSVHAGNDEYKPRPAVKKKVENQEVTGELVRTDPKKKMLVVRLDNGMEQTFEFDEHTSVAGLGNSVQTPMPQKPGKMINPEVGNLIGKEGSELTVEWRADGDAKIATHVEVTQLITAKSPRKARRRLRL